MKKCDDIQAHILMASIHASGEALSDVAVVVGGRLKFLSRRTSRYVKRLTDAASQTISDLRQRRYS